MADHAKRYLAGLGVPKEYILSLDTPKNTVQEIDHARSASKRLETPITAGISSEWHLVAKRLCELNGYPFFGAEEVLSGNPRYERVVATLREDPAVPDLLKSQSQKLKFIGTPVGRVIYNMLSELTRNKRAVVNDVTGPSFQQLTGNNNV